MSEHSRQQQVVELLKGLETGQAPSLGYINPEKYIQHNLAAKDSLKGLEEFLGQIPANTIRVNTETGEYVTRV